MLKLHLYQVIKNLSVTQIELNGQKVTFQPRENLKLRWDTLKTLLNQRNYIFN